jgi:hypothetical protein
MHQLCALTITASASDAQHLNAWCPAVVAAAAAAAALYVVRHIKVQHWGRPATASGHDSSSTSSSAR